MKLKRFFHSPEALIPLAVLASLLVFSDHMSYRQEGISMTAVENTVTSRGVTVEVLNTVDQIFWNSGDYDPGCRLQRRLCGLWFPMRQAPAQSGGTVCMTLPVCYYEKDIPQRLNFQWGTDYKFPFSSLYPGRYRLVLDFYEKGTSSEHGAAFSLAAEFSLE